MSGLCGWYSRDGAALPIEQMAAPLTRFDGAPLQSGTLGCGALALAGRAGSVSMHHEDGLLVALWGGGGADALARRWRSDGVKACATLTGAFACAILDEREDEAYLAIDRSATNPLCYQLAGRVLVFASSGDALIAHPGVSRTIDAQAVYNYLHFHTVPAPDSIYQSQRRLQPGEFVHFRAGKLTRGKYWSMQFHEHETRAFPDLKAAFLDTVREAVRAAAGEHKVGAFLSGGTDSSTIAAMLGQVTGRPARTYSIGFDVPGYDELAYAGLVARHFGTEHHERYVGAFDVAEAIPQIAAMFDQPFGNASAVPAFYCARMAREDGIVRLLGGDGGDELFGGNERYARQAVFGRYETIPYALRQLLIEPLLFKVAGGVQAALARKARSYIEQASVPLPARLETYNLLQRYGSAQVLHADFLAAVDTGAPLAALSQAYWKTHGLSQINRLLALDIQFTLADNDLPKVMKACELAGLEAAFPFLDEAVVAFSARLTPRQKLKGTRLRHFFKEALRGTLPEQVLSKKKHGFGLPFGHWLQTQPCLKSIAYDSLSDLKARRIVRADFIDSLLGQRVGEHPAYHGTMVWVLMMLEQWFVQREPAWPLVRAPARHEHTASSHA